MKRHRFLKFDISLYKVILFSFLVAIDLSSGGGIGLWATVGAFILGISNIVSLG